MIVINYTSMDKNKKVNNFCYLCSIIDRGGTSNTVQTIIISGRKAIGMLNSVEQKNKTSDRPISNVESSFSLQKIQAYMYQRCGQRTSNTGVDCLQLERIYGIERPVGLKRNNEIRLLTGAVETVIDEIEQRIFRSYYAHEKRTVGWKSIQVSSELGYCRKEQKRTTFNYTGP